MGRQKIGANNDINSILQRVNDEQLIPILPEMQQMFDMNQLEAQQQQAYQKGTLPIDNYNGQPQIMDQSIVNMARSGKLQLPMVNGFQMSSQMDQSMGGMPMGAPTSGNIFETGLQNLNEGSGAENKLSGGGKNYFLKKKK